MYFYIVKNCLFPNSYPVGVFIIIGEQTNYESFPLQPGVSAPGLQRKGEEVWLWRLLLKDNS